MKTPPFLLGAALFFWGWETGLPWLGGALGLALEASRLARRDWDPGLKEFSRVSDLSSVLLAALAVYFYATLPAVTAFSSLVKFSVLPLYPVALAQAFSARGAVDFGALLFSARRRAAGGPPGPFVDVTRPFFVACLLAAGAANVRGPVFYFATVALFAWFLWPARPVYARAWARVPLLALAAALGYAGQFGLHNLQIFLEGKGGLIFGQAGPGDPYRSHTSIGQVGELKQYGTIVLRLKKSGPGRVPGLLREAAFDSYKAGEWRAREAPFVPAAAVNGDGWAVSAGPAAQEFSVYSRFERGRGLLALPAGARAVSGLPAEDVGINRLGTVHVDGTPARPVYGVAWDPAPGAGRDAPPGPGDLALPDGEAALVKRLAGELGLASLPPEEALAALHGYFSREYRYSLFQAAGGGVSPLERFLTQTRAGHCEYFATATALLLRAAGIPARYATGYSVQEYSRLQKAYLVRKRHAHAWALAYVNGTWLDADNTPSTWLDEETARASPAEPLKDAWAWLAYNFFTFRPGLPAGWKFPLFFLLAAAGGFALRKTARRFFSARPDAQGAAEARPGLDSEFYAVERALSLEGFGRRQGESVRAWTRRLSGPGGVPGAGELGRLAALHNRLRFDPAGLPPGGREELKAGARGWLEKRKKAKV